MSSLSDVAPLTPLTPVTPMTPMAAMTSAAQPEPMPETLPAPAPVPEEEALPDPASFAAVVQLVEEKREATLTANLLTNVHLVDFQPGRIEFRPDARAPGDLASRLSQFLNDNTARSWLVAVSQQEGADTLQDQESAIIAAAHAEAATHPMVKAVMETFPGSTIDAIDQAIPEGDDNP